jgi:hypothetical protein
MAWQAIKTGTKAKEFEEHLTLPIRYNKTKLTMTKRWLKSIGQGEAERATFVYDDETRLVGLQFLPYDVIGGSRIVEDRSTVQRYVSSSITLALLNHYGYPSKTSLAVEEGKDGIWIIKKPE